MKKRKHSWTYFIWLVFLSDLWLQCWVNIYLGLLIFLIYWPLYHYIMVFWFYSFWLKVYFFLIQVQVTLKWYRLELHKSTYIHFFFGNYIVCYYMITWVIESLNVEPWMWRADCIYMQIFNCMGVSLAALSPGVFKGLLYSYYCSLLVFICMEYLFLSLPILSVSLHLKWESWRQHIVGACIFLENLVHLC